MKEARILVLSVITLEIIEAAVETVERKAKRPISQSTLLERFLCIQQKCFRRFSLQ